ncbi:MAG TPA: PKD domain-containing protein [Roseiflexaceae bacterium]|nr:PKD domain-containing protein [Roseiflexaceae bacterium]
MIRQSLLRIVALTLLLFAALPTAAASRPSLALAAVQTAPWLDSKVQDGIVYFLFATPPKIERYALQSGIWLSPIELAATPTAFTVDSDGMYISFGRSTSRFTLSGAGQTHLLNTITDVQSLHTIGQFLYLNYANYPYGTITSINKLTGVQVDSKDYIYAMLVGTSVAPTRGKLFGRDTGLSPADIRQVVLNADGTLGASTDSPYHGDYPSASMTYVFPGEARVADDSGIIYNTVDLTYNNSLAGHIDDLAFYGDLPIVLRGSTLIAYSNSFQETGRYALASQPRDIFVAGATIYAFVFGGARGVDVVQTPLSLLTPAQPGQPVDPNGLAYTPDSTVLSTDGVLYLLSRANLSIFRWSVAERRYLQTIPLAEAPSYMAYSDSTNRLYLAYPSGKLTQIRLNEATSEQAFANSPQPPCGLATAGEYVFTCDPSGAWVSHFTYSPDGALITQREWNYFSTEYIWSAANRKMYFFRDDTSPNDVIWENIDLQGNLGTQQDSPYHDSAGITHPIRVAPDGSVVLLGSGRIYDASSLALVNALSNNIDDAVWDSGLYTLRMASSNTEIQKWGAGYGLSSSRQTEGQPIRMFPTAAGKLVITNFYGVPRFSIWNNALGNLFATPTLVGLTATNSSPNPPGQTTYLHARLAQSAGPVAYTWSFGDGATGSGPDPAHVYAAPGSYTAIVTATNGVDLLSASTTITVAEVPIAGLSATNDSPTMLGYSTSLHAQVASGSRVSYSWSFGDGTTGSGATPTHTYGGLGVYTAVVTASNSLSSLRATTTVTISESITPVIQVDPAQLNFSGVEGGGPPEPQAFTIRNIGAGSLTWAADENLTWLTLSSTQGSAPAVVTATINLSKLSAGTYTGQINIRSLGVQTPPRAVGFTLVVGPPQPGPRLSLSAEPGYSSIKLSWNPASALDVATYRVSRAAGGAQSFAPIATTGDTGYLDTDSSLVTGTTYCYRVEALRADLSEIVASNAACAVFGQVELWIPDTWAAPGQLAIVPVNIRNAHGLRIAASDIWLNLNGQVLEPIGIAATPFTAGYTWSYGISGNGTTSQVRIAALSNTPPILYGDGSLFWLTVRVRGNTGDVSPLDLREFIYGVGGSTIYAPEDLAHPVPLQLEDGVFRVAAAYILGDLNGNSAVEAADALLALKIASNAIAPSPEQRSAGDINGNGQIDAGDATMILYYAAYGQWPTLAAGQAGAPAVQAVSPIDLSLDSVQAQPGATVQFTIRADHLEDFAGGTFVLAYDPSLIAEVTAVQPAELTPGFAVQFHDDHSGLVYIALANSTPVSGSGAVLRISVRVAPAVASGASAPVVLAQAQLNDINGRDFAASALSKTITRHNGALVVQEDVAEHRLYLPLLAKH